MTVISVAVKRLPSRSLLHKLQLMSGMSIVNSFFIRHVSVAIFCKEWKGSLAAILINNYIRRNQYTI